MKNKTNNKEKPSSYLEGYKMGIEEGKVQARLQIQHTLRQIFGFE